MDRSSQIIRTSWIGIIANVLLAAFKAFVGLASNSVAIVMDAVNNISDAASSVITIAGTKLAAKEPDKKHPFGYGRIEYLSAMIIAVLVLYAGITAFGEGDDRAVIIPCRIGAQLLGVFFVPGDGYDSVKAADGGKEQARRGFAVPGGAGSHFFFQDVDAGRGGCYAGMIFFKPKIEILLGLGACGRGVFLGTTPKQAKGCSEKYDGSFHSIRFQYCLSKYDKPGQTLQESCLGCGFQIRIFR